jgi:WD40 repeat protein
VHVRAGAAVGEKPLSKVYIIQVGFVYEDRDKPVVIVLKALECPNEAMSHDLLGTRMLVGLDLVKTDKGHLICTATSDGFFLYWLLTDIRFKEASVSSPGIFHLNQRVDIYGIISCSISESAKYALFVSTESCHIFSLILEADRSSGKYFISLTSNGCIEGKDIHGKVTAETSESQFNIEGASFLGDDNVLLWCHSGPICLYSFSKSIGSDSELSFVHKKRLIVPERQGGGAINNHADRVVSIFPTDEFGKKYQVYLAGSEAGIGNYLTWEVSEISEELHPSEIVSSVLHSISKNFMKNSTESADTVTSSHIFDSGFIGLVIAFGYINGKIRYHTLDENGIIFELDRHESRITSLLGIPSKLVAQQTLEILRPPLILSGSEDGTVKFYRLDTNQCIYTICSHISSISFFLYSSFMGPNGGKKELEQVFAVCADYSFSLYDLSIEWMITASNEVSSLKSSSSDTALSKMHKHFEATFENFEKTQLLFKRVVICSGHDSEVVSVIRNSWCSQCDYVISISACGLVYVWLASSGRLDRVLNSKEGRDFMLKRDFLKFEKENDIRATYMHSRLVHHDLSDDAVDLVSKLHAVNDEIAPSKEKVSNSAFGVYKGLGYDLNVLTFYIDINHLSNINCLSIPSMSSGMNEDGYETKSIDLIPKARKSFEGKIFDGNREGQFSSDLDAKDPKLKHASIFQAYDKKNLLLRELRICLSFLLDWNHGIDTSMEKGLKRMLALFDPSEVYSPLSDSFSITFGLADSSFISQKNSYSLTLLLPSSTEESKVLGSAPSTSRWQFSKRCTSVHAISLNALCMNLMTTGSAFQQSLFSRLVSYYSIVIATTFPRYIDCSLLILAYFGLHRCESVHVASRMLLQSVIERLTYAERHKLFKYWSKFYLEIPKYHNSLISNSDFMVAISELLSDVKNNMIDVNPEDFIATSFSEFSLLALTELNKAEKQLIAVLILSFIILEYPEEFDVRFSKVLCIHLITLVCDRDINDAINTSLAADILGKGIDFWKRQTTDMPRLIQTLLRLSCRKDESGNTILTSAVERTLLNAAQAAPKVFIGAINSEVLRPSISSEERASYVMLLVSVVKKYPESQLVVLPRIVEVLTRCLDPAEPSIRKALIKPCTAALHALTKCYPMISFHQESQLFAVGTDSSQKSVVLIYDLRTATKWRILEGHSGDLTAISFSSDGNSLASYSGSESPPSVKIWRTGGGGLLSGLLGLEGKCTRTFDIRKLEDPNRSVHRMLRNTKLTWSSESTIRLVREDSSVMNFTV